MPTNRAVADAVEQRKETAVHAWDNPTEPDRQPPDGPETPDDPGGPRQPGERPPFDQDPDAQRAPGSEDDNPGGGPPMQAAASDDVTYQDAPGTGTEPVGNNNIRDGRVRGVMGLQGQGG